MPKKRRIIQRLPYRSINHPRSAMDSVVVKLSCGHSKVYKGSQEPNIFAWCKECDNA